MQNRLSLTKWNKDGLQSHEKSQWKNSHYSKKKKNKKNTVQDFIFCVLQVIGNIHKFLIPRKKILLSTSVKTWLWNKHIIQIQFKGCTVWTKGFQLCNALKVFNYGFQRMHSMHTGSSDKSQYQMSHLSHLFFFLLYTNLNLQESILCYLVLRIFELNWTIIIFMYPGAYDICPYRHNITYTYTYPPLRFFIMYE